MTESKVLVKPSDPISRLKVQEKDDEHWISEEELYTEGSSDEEKSGHHCPKRRLRKEHKSPVGRLIPQPQETPPVGKHVPKTDKDDVAVSVVLQPSDISWRPKRGSIKLPDIELPLDN